MSNQASSLPERRRMIAQRPYGSKLPNDKDCPSKSRLPKQLPILGLGCSSFSNFFSRNNDEELSSSTGDGFNDDLSWVTPDHSQVCVWVDTIVYAVTHYGINLLDTAPWYGHGSSEIVIGYAMCRLLQRREQEDKDDVGTMTRSDMIINTKVGRYGSHPSKMFDFSADRVHQSVLISIERMKCNYIDVIQLHDPEFAPSIDLLVEETIPKLVQLRDKHGLVKAIGITGYPLGVQREILARCPPGTFDQSLTYGHFNLHDQSLFASGFADYVQEHQHMGLMCAAPLSMGLLTPLGPPDWHPASGQLKAACREASCLCTCKNDKDNSNSNINISRLAIAFALSDTRISCTLLGMCNRKEVDQAMDVANLFSSGPSPTVSDEEEYIYEDVVKTLERKGFNPKEVKTMSLLLDRNTGPFAQIISNGEYQWDGVREVEEFWKQVEGGKVKADVDMRKRANHLL